MFSFVFPPGGYAYDGISTVWFHLQSAVHVFMAALLSFTLPEQVYFLGCLCHASFYEATSWLCMHKYTACLLLHQFRSTLQGFEEILNIQSRLWSFVCIQQGLKFSYDLEWVPHTGGIKVVTVTAELMSSSWWFHWTLPSSNVAFFFFSHQGHDFELHPRMYFSSSKQTKGPVTL